MATIQVRSRKLGDLTAVAQLCHQQLQPMSWREVADHLTSRRGIRVARLNGRIAGFYLAVWFDGHEALWLDLIAVEPSHLKSGIGRAMLADFEEQAANAGFRRLELATDVGNLAAIRFYERAGYATAPNAPAPGKVGFSKILPVSGDPTSSRPAAAKLAFGSYDGHGNLLLKLALRARKAVLTLWILARRLH